MKKAIATFAAGLLSIAAISGYSLNDISEYAQLAQTGTHKFVESKIPNSVQIKRTGLILDKIDTEIEQIKHQLAKEEIGLQRSQQDWQTATQRRTSYVGNLRNLRSLDVQIDDRGHVSIGCSKISATEVDAKMEVTLSLYREYDHQCQQSKKLMAIRRKAVDSLRQNLGQWNDERVLLEQRLATFRTRNEVELASNAIEGTANDPSELKRAEKLINKTEELLDVAQRKRELDGKFSGDPFLGQKIETIAENDINSEIDAILSEH